MIEKSIAVKNACKTKVHEHTAPYLERTMNEWGDEWWRDPYMCFSIYNYIGWKTRNLTRKTTFTRQKINYNYASSTTMMAMIMMTATIKGLKEIIKLNFMISRAKTVTKKKFLKKIKLRCLYKKVKKIKLHEK